MGSQNWWFGDPRTLLYRVKPLHRSVQWFLGMVESVKNITINKVKARQFKAKSAAQGKLSRMLEVFLRNVGSSAVMWKSLKFTMYLHQVWSPQNGFIVIYQWSLLSSRQLCNFWIRTCGTLGKHSFSQGWNVGGIKFWDSWCHQKKTAGYSPSNPSCLMTGSLFHGVWNSPHITG